MKKYEYRIETFRLNDNEGSRNEIAQILSGLGTQGWELVSVVSLTEYAGEHALFYFKRERE